MLILKITAIATVTFFTGAGVFFGWSSGLPGVVMSPILAAFGWYWFPLILLLVGLLWRAYKPRAGSIYQSGFIGMCGVTGWLISVAVYGRGFASNPVLGEALRAAFSVSGVVAGGLITILKENKASRRSEAEKGETA